MSLRIADVIAEKCSQAVRPQGDYAGDRRKGSKRSGTLYQDWCLIIEFKVFVALLHMRTHRGLTPMSDRKTRLLEAERALHHLEIQVEQYRIHLEELAQHPSEAAKANVMLERISMELLRQRKCHDLQKAVPA